MTRPKQPLVYSFLRAFWRVVPIAGVVAGLSACSLVDAKSGDDPQVVSYQHRKETNYVRIERIETGAPDNAHPRSLSADAMRIVLSKLNVNGTGALFSNTASKPIFTEEELAEI